MSNSNKMHLMMMMMMWEKVICNNQVRMLATRARLLDLHQGVSVSEKCSYVNINSHFLLM